MIDFGCVATANFYPRPPRGGRLDKLVAYIKNLRFLSTPSARRATRRSRSGRQCSRNFYPRPPRGGRHFKSISGYTQQQFLSTPSARRATFFDARSAAKYAISIHALREEGDQVH